MMDHGSDWKILLIQSIILAVVCFDETFKPLFGEARPAQRLRPGALAWVDYEYAAQRVLPPNA